MSILARKKFKLGRRLGVGVHEKCQSQKFMLAQARRAKNSKRGRPRRRSDYGMSLIEKQRVRFSYGLKEKQFRRNVDEAINAITKGAVPSEKLHQLLESRLDNAVYRLGIAPTRPAARQLVSHGHFLVNGKRMKVPSYRVREGDVITLREGSKNKPVFDDLAKRLKGQKLPNWMSFDTTKVEAVVKGVATDPDPFLNFQAVIEFYSK